MTSNPSSPVYPVRLITAFKPLQQPTHREVIVPDRIQRLVEERLERLEGTRALDGDHGGVDGAIARSSPRRLLGNCSNWLSTTSAIRSIADNDIGEGLAVDQDIVDHAPAVGRHQAILDLEIGKRATWLVVTRSSHSRTPGPSNVNRPMWLMSKSPTRCRTAWCSSTIVVY